MFSKRGTYPSPIVVDASVFAAMSTMQRARYISTQAPEARALGLLWENGVVFAGANTVGGTIVRVAYPTLAAMERRGDVVLRISPDGGVMACVPR